MKQKEGLDALPDDLLVNPDVYLYDLDFTENTARFVLMDRDCYRNSPFLDNRMSRVNEDIYSVGLGALLRLEEAAPAMTRPVNFVFHHGACGSTLIARCLDITGASLSLREPIALHQLAIARRQINAASKREMDSWRRVLRLVLRFLARTYDDQEVAMVKPSDWCNNIIPDVLDAHNRSAALLVYRDLRSFLLSTLKSQEGRNWMQGCLARALHDLSGMDRLCDIDPERLADAEVTACVWLAEMYSFKRLLDAASGRLKSLHGDNFMNDPLSALGRITDFLDLPVSADMLEAIASGPAFHADSKRSWKSFDKAAHTEQKKLLAESLTDEIEQGLLFKDKVTRDNPLPERLPLAV